MGKKSRKERITSGPAPAKAAPAAESKNPAMIIRLLLGILVLGMYGASLNFDFTLDDDLFYIKHKFVQQGFSAIGDMFRYGSLFGFDGTTGVQPYRPFTLMVYALQKELFSNSSEMAHMVNVTLYILSVQLVFSLSQKLIPRKDLIYPTGIAFLFAVHPIHTEVVSNVKSMDELLVAVLGLASWKALMPDEKGNMPGIFGWISGCLFFLLALMSKESGIAFMAIIPLSIYMLTPAGLKKSLFSLLPLAALSAFFLVLRHNVVGTQPASSGIPLLENVLNGAKSFSELWATKFEILFYYIRLLFVPWPLNWDYSFNQIPLVGWNSPLSIAGLLIYGGLFALALWQFRKKPVLSFCILFFFIASAPTNNFFFNNGATVGERFLFVPSLGYTIGVVWVLGYWFKITGNGFFIGQNKTFTLLLGAIGVLFAILSYQRSADWKDNLTLFERGVERSPKSSRTQYSLASECMKLAQKAEDPAEARDFLDKATVHFAKSLEIFPKNVQAHYNFAICYSLFKDTSRAIYHYREALRYDTVYENAMNNLGVMYMGRGRLDSAKYYFEKSIRIKPGAKIPLENMCDVYGKQGELMNRAGDKRGAIASFKKCLEYSPENEKALAVLGITYINLGSYDSALIYLNRAYNRNKGDIRIVENISLAGFLSGDYSLAVEYANKALAIDRRSRRGLSVLADSYQATGNAAEAAKYRSLLDQTR